MSPADSRSMRSVRALLHAIVDYAGLFPPAGLDMSTAVANYARYRGGGHAWMLGRFVVPAGRLAELCDTRIRLAPPGDDTADGWPLSVLIGADIEADIGRIVEWIGGDGASVVMPDALELAATSPDVVDRWGSEMPSGLHVYWEIPPRDPKPFVERIARIGQRAKVRTGGVTPDAFPPPHVLVGFMGACCEAGIPFKATAGLHHPVRARYPLTYEPDSAFGSMYGFLNVFLAALAVNAGWEHDRVTRLLEESNPSTFAFGPSGVTWRERCFETADIETARRSVATSFGSCSFEEPVDDLKGIGIL